MIWPSIQKIKELKSSGKMRKSDEKFWEGDKKTYDLWLSMVIERLEKENGKKTDI